MKGTWIREAALLTVGLILMGFFVKLGLNSITDNQRVVSVKGLAEKEVKANKVTWPICVKQAGNDLAEMYAMMSKSNQVVKNFLIKNGIPANEITVNAPQITDKDAEQYTSNGNFR